MRGAQIEPLRDGEGFKPFVREIRVGMGIMSPSISQSVFDPPEPKQTVQFLPLAAQVGLRLR